MQCYARQGKARHGKERHGNSRSLGLILDLGRGHGIDVDLGHAEDVIHGIVQCQELGRVLGLAHGLGLGISHVLVLVHGKGHGLMVDFRFLFFSRMNFLKANKAYHSIYRLWFHVIYTIIVSM